jgi:hypothetical protein
MVLVCLSAGNLAIRQDRVESATVLFTHWQLNEGSGTTTVDSELNRSGTLRNGARWVTGLGGTAVAMDGVDDYIALPALEATGQAFSIAVWVRNTSLPTGVSQQFIAKASDSTEQGTYWMLGQTNSRGENLLRFRLKTGGRTTTLTASKGRIPLNTWYHAVATYDGTRMRLYLNGTQVGTDRKTGSMSSGSGVPVHIGRSPDGSGYLRGAIDDLRIYRSALTASEVEQVMAAGSNGTANQPPAVSLSSPANGASFAAGATVTMSATASDADGTVSRVVFYAGSTAIGSDTSSPFSVSWPSVAVGSYTLKAVATDNAGAVTESATRTVTVSSSSTPSNQAPSVSLTSPASGATFIAPATIALSANASDTDGSITRVDFYRGTSLIGSDTSGGPYSVSWTGVAAGSYSLTAVARDNAGATTVSSTREVTVRSASLPTTAIFTPSSNHATAVDRYVLEIFPAGADTRVANAVATRDLGKPSVSGGECRVDVTSTIFGLSAGNYVATISAVGDGGTTQSAPSAQFTR